MTNDTEKREKQVSQALEAQLNRHGFGFQYAIAKRAEELKKNGGDVAWWLEGTEIPVGIGSDLIHIDIVFAQEDRYQKDSDRFYVVAECKRADPAKSNWCFAKSPYTWRSTLRTKDSIQFDKINRFDPDSPFTGSTLINYVSSGSFELGFECKTDQPGDGIGSHYKTAINDAVTQVLRSTKGLINYLIERSPDDPNRRLGKENTFVPVIFTTANLYTTVSDISASDLTSGKINPNSIEVKKVDWLWFTHNRSLNLTHATPLNTNANADYDLYFRDFSRTIAIISPSGIDNFMTTRFRDWFW